MKRRSLCLTGTAAFLAGVTLPLAAAPVSKPGGLSIQWLGHTCFLFTSREGRILVNPFRPSGCTAGYRRPNMMAELVLLSSRLLDEGALDVVKGNPRVLYQPGVFTIESFDKVQGIRTLHDRKDGRQFGVNVAWRWRQAGIDIVHLGGIAAPLDDEVKILLGKPDLLLIPVGGTDRSFDAELARQAIEVLQPRMVVPTQYKTQAADENCDLAGVDPFLKLFKDEDIRQLGSATLSLAVGSLPRGNGPQVRVFTYNFSGKPTASR